MSGLTCLAIGCLLRQHRKAPFGAPCILPALTLCAFAIAYANQSQTFTVNSLALFASAFDWSKPTACFFGQTSSHSARGLLTAASDPNFRNFAVQHRWHGALRGSLSFTFARLCWPQDILLNAVLSCLEDLEFIIVRLQPALPALPALEMHSHEPVDLTSCSQI